MSCCCIKTLNLCDAPVCGVLEIEQAVVLESGESGADLDYTLELDYFQSKISITQGQTVGENIQFDISLLNENFQYTGKILDPFGVPVNISSGGEIYDCIKFKTVMNVTSY